MLISVFVILFTIVFIVGFCWCWRSIGIYSAVAIAERVLGYLIAQRTSIHEHCAQCKQLSVQVNIWHIFI